MLNVGTLSQDNLLCVCGKELDGGQTLILIESGKMKESRRNPGRLIFHPHWKLPSSEWSEPGNVDSVVNRIVHFECFVESFNGAGLTWKNYPKNNKCGVCSLEYTKCKMLAHRYTAGEIDRDSFIPDREMKMRYGTVCIHCASEVAKDPPDVYDHTVVVPRRGQLLLL